MRGVHLSVGETNVVGAEIIAKCRKVDPLGLRSQPTASKRVNLSIYETQFYLGSLRSVTL